MTWKDWWVVVKTWLLVMSGLAAAALVGLLGRFLGGGGD